MKITLIGNGMMAKALALGLVKNHEVEILGRDMGKLQRLKESIPEISTKVLDDKEDISGKCVIFCVKPYALESVAVRLVGKAEILISILAGTKIDTLKKHINSKYYIRTMPNVAASTLSSMTTITGDKEVKKLSLDVFNSIGKTLWLNTENELDVATAIAGSGPAFLALVAEGIADGGVKAGLARPHCNTLVQGLFESVASLLEHNHPAIIKDSVQSPGGTTAAGSAELEENGVRSSMIKAVGKAYEKASELSKK